MADFGEYITILNLDHLIYIAGLAVIAAAFFLNTNWVRKHRNIITRLIILVIAA